MTQELLKLALEALEDACGECCNAEYNPCFQRKAITAIKKALAQEQEPVAWEQFYPDIGKPQIAFNAEVIGYVAPQRPWVGLTDEEIDQGLLRSNHALQTAGAWRDGVEWATKQLKEKNT